MIELARFFFNEKFDEYTKNSGISLVINGWFYFIFLKLQKWVKDEIFSYSCLVKQILGINQ